MMTKDQLIIGNIDNLVTLWKTAGAAFQAYFNKGDYEYVQIPGSEWPNKIWFNREISRQDAELVLAQNSASDTNLVIPYWDLYGTSSLKNLEAGGFTEKSRQIAMCLELGNRFDEQKRLDFKRLTSSKDMKEWAALYPQAFGYSISETILVNTFTEIHYYLACFENQPVGTAIMFQTGEIIGIHGVGVSPDARRSGYAEEIMKFVLNRAIDMGARYTMLQASDMGKGLYDKLGFETQFVIKNYIGPGTL
ncbi:ribosomal protein S18 acetylase RimI-like enzyme [Pedobacter africanus]|uniref:Ribosomal protein S18 acetylase RimI-like enzyme n=1 Tax=Pedobacter africanus TaxID=151894 RepID=A0ACC6KUQ5_9SPHI|nr:GNAT family N-acetyltransferase [Pedobacter africanus]MDR6782974.1 ribosomal protein S18 acetylase RimI-like enzyme [Pedobacter africanus]